jgi:hypothetical protein
MATAVGLARRTDNVIRAAGAKEKTRIKNPRMTEYCSADNGDTSRDAT